MTLADQVLGEMECIACGCTEEDACEGGCFWAEIDPPVCSRCANEGAGFGESDPPEDEA